MDAIKLYTWKLTRRVQSMSSRSCTKPKQTGLTCFWKGSWMMYDPEHWGRNRSRGSQVLYCVITSLDLSGGGPPNWPTASHGLVAKSSYSLSDCEAVSSSVILHTENSTVILSAATKGARRRGCSSRLSPATSMGKRTAPFLAAGSALIWEWGFPKHPVSCAEEWVHCQCHPQRKRSIMSQAVYQTDTDIVLVMAAHAWCLCSHVFLLWASHRRARCNASLIKVAAVFMLVPVWLFHGFIQTPLCHSGWDGTFEVGFMYIWQRPAVFFVPILSRSCTCVSVALTSSCSKCKL